LGAPSAASGAESKRSKKAGPPDPTISAPPAPASSSSRRSGAAAASNAARGSGSRTFSPSAPSGSASAASASPGSPSTDVRRLAYFSWKGYGVVSPSDGGKEADLTAFSTQAPVGVPANLPVTVADVTLPLLPMTTLTIAIPWTLNSL
jgi:hypothetical protein